MSKITTFWQILLLSMMIPHFNPSYALYKLFFYQLSILIFSRKSIYFYELYLCKYKFYLIQVSSSDWISNVFHINTFVNLSLVTFLAISDPKEGSNVKYISKSDFLVKNCSQLIYHNPGLGKFKIYPLVTPDDLFSLQ